MLCRCPGFGRDAIPGKRSRTVNTSTHGGWDVLPDEARAAGEGGAIRVLFASRQAGAQLRSGLEMSGFAWHEAGDLPSVITLAQSFRPACLVLDRFLYGTDGVEILDSLRRSDGSLPFAVVVLTEPGSTEAAVAAIKAGAQDCIALDRLNSVRLKSTILDAAGSYRALENYRLSAQRNERLAALVNASRDAMIWLSWDWRIQAWNPGAAQLFGYREDEVCGQSYELIVPQPFRTESLAVKAGVLDGREAVLRETFRRQKNGDLIEVEIQAAPILDGRGRVNGICCVYRSLGERKTQVSCAAHATVAQLAEKDSLLSLFIENAPAAIAMFDTSMCYVAVSRRFLSDYNFPPHENLIGRSHYEVFPDLPAKWPEIHARVLAGEELASEDEAFPRASGQVQWLRWAMKPWRLANGSIAGALLFSEIITDRVEARHALTEQEERMQAIVETAQQGIWAVDRDGKTVFANPRPGELLGVQSSDLTGEPVVNFCFPDDADEGRERILSNLNGHREEFEFRFRRADGLPIHVLAATAPLRNKDGETVGALGGFVDLTERRRAEERQRALMMELAHRSKNLLTVIQSIANRSFSGSISFEEAKSAFAGRLQALGRTYGSLTGEAFEGAMLADIVAAELSAFGGRARFRGPPVLLSAKVAQIFALVVHELSTNAAKYGALSAPGGHVDVVWTVDNSAEARFFKFDWKEFGGPPVTAPKRRGFGGTLISTVAGAEFDCTPTLAYDTAGFCYGFETSIGAMGQIIEESPVRQKLKTQQLRDLYDSWARLRGSKGQLPDFAKLDRDRFGASGGLTVADISPDGNVRFTSVGRALVERLGVKPDDSSSLAAGEGLAEAYRRCASDRQPCYEHLRFDFGDGDPVTFERLLLPFSRGGRRASHVAGMAVFGGQTGPDRND